MIASNDIYEAIKQIIPQELPTKFGYIDISKVKNEKTEVLKNTVAIYIRAASDGIRDIKGGYKIETARVIFNLYTDRGEKGVLFGESYCKAICDALDSCYNQAIETEGAHLLVMQFNRQGRPVYLGPTEQGIATFSINYVIKYSGK